MKEHITNEQREWQRQRACVLAEQGWWHKDIIQESRQVRYNMVSEEVLITACVIDL
jgi:hypothetical protein